MKGYLNVILHGSFAFIRRRDEDNSRYVIDAEIPRVPDHVFRAGNWLAETEIRELPRGEYYELKGVTPGSGSELKGGAPSEGTKPDARHNLILRQASALAEPYAVLRFPIPEKITSLRRARISRTAFEGSTVQMKKLREPHVIV